MKSVSLLCSRAWLMLFVAGGVLPLAAADSLFVASPTSLTFTFTPATAPPAFQTLHVTATAGAGVAQVFQAVADGNWLGFDVGGTFYTTLPGSTPMDLNVRVDTTGLAAGTYTSQIRIGPPGGQSTVTIPVTLTSSSVPPPTGNFSISPTTLTYNYQVGGTAPAQQSFTLSNNASTTLDYQIVANTSSGPVGWLNVTGQSGNLSAGQSIVIPVPINTAGVTPGSYQGNIAIRSNAANNTPLSIPVTLNASTTAVLSTSPSQLNFAYQTGTAVPAAQYVQLTTSSGVVSYQVSSEIVSPQGGSWITTSPASGSTPGVVVVGINPTGLAAGTYTGNVVITAAGATTATQKIPVSLVVSTTPLILAAPLSMQFAYQQVANGPNPPAQTLQISTTAGSGANQAFTITASSGTPAWLSVSTASGNTPASVTVTANPATLTPGTYQGTITITGQNAANVINIPVTLTVSQFPLFSVSSSMLTFSTISSGSAPPAQSLTVASTSVGIPFTISTTSTGGWLLVDRSTGRTDDTSKTFNVSVNPTGLAQGTYLGQISIAAFGVPNSPYVIPVVLVVSNSITFSPTSLTFTQFQGAAMPPAQNVTVGSSGTQLTITTAVSTASGGNWLSAAPVSGATPMQVSISVNGANLPTGQYTGSVTLSAPNATNSPQVIPITLNVLPPTNVTVNPVSLQASGQVGQPNPTSQTIALQSSGAAVGFTVSSTTSSGGGWLSVSPTSGTTPQNVTVAYNIAGLTPGTYTGTVTFSVAGLNPINVPVTLTIADLPKPVLQKVANAASYVPGAIAPGEIIVLGGTNIGPTTLAGLQLNGNGTVATQVAGTRVLFDGIPAPIIYVRNDQSAVIVPYEVAGRFVTNITVELNGRASDPISQRVEAAAPGIFTQSAQGVGQGSILNQDYSLNTPQRPASRGDVISIFGTGEGQVSPAGITGSVVTGIKIPLQQITAKIGGIPAQVTFYGSAPAQVAGVLQVNVRIPDGVPSGTASVEITVGTSGSSQAGVTVSIR